MAARQTFIRLPWQQSLMCLLLLAALAGARHVMAPRLRCSAAHTGSCQVQLCVHATSIRAVLIRLASQQRPHIQHDGMYAGAATLLAPGRELCCWMTHTMRVAALPGAAVQR